MRPYMHGFVFIMGLALVVGGIATRILGASVVGFIVAGVNFRNWWKHRDGDVDHDSENPQEKSDGKT